tara:strand:+ start:4889 stop:5587 length:699 start_codon:yes stop_codon:yes gene_type:complete
MYLFLIIVILLLVEFIKDNSIGIILYIIIIVVFLFLNTKTKTIETLKNNEYVILMGDSIFKNDVYVKLGNSVGSKLQEKHDNVIVVAEDGGKIQDLNRQFKSIPERAKLVNTNILISVGGNDLLEKYELDDVNNLNYVNSIFNKYTSEVNNIKNMCDCNIVLCNIYYPRSKEYVKYYNIIEKWNKKLYTYAKNNNIQLISLDSTMNDKKYFTNDIEPSSSGGDIIIDNIMNL